MLVSFHIHSFAVFYTEEGPATIVTCLLTARNHILLNMQDQILQIMQLIQYRISNLFSILITNNFIGEEVTFDVNSVCGYKMMVCVCVLAFGYKGGYCKVRDTNR